MGNENFRMEKSFGLSTLLTIVEKDNPELKVSDNGSEITANVSLNELKPMVNKTLETHNITLKIE